MASRKRKSCKCTVKKKRSCRNSKGRFTRNCPKKRK